MSRSARLALGALLIAAAAAAGAQPTAAAPTEGLVPVKAKNMDEAWLLPGADFRPYRKVLLKNAEVSFQRSWLRDMNDNSVSKVSRVSQADAMRIVEAVRGGFDQIWATAFQKSGYEIVKAPGEGVLEVSPRVVDLYINAVDRPTTVPSRTYTLQAGEATLRMEVRDAQTGTLLGRVADKRQTTRTPTAEVVTSGTNAAAFGQLFATWAVIAVKGLEELKAHSPVPEDLKPGQRVAPKK